MSSGGLRSYITFVYIPGTRAIGYTHGSRDVTDTSGGQVRELKHGKYSTYVLDRCRCDECRTANREYKRRYLAKQRAEASK